MKVVFLDFDGPLFNQKSLEYPENQLESSLNKCQIIGVHPFYTYWRAQIEIIEVLNYLALQKYLLVISSSWADARMHSEAQVRNLLFENGVLMQLHPDWATPREHSKIRAEQIAQWLSRHKDVDNYLVLDDAESGEGLDRPQAYGLQNINVFLADPNTGFSSQQLQEMRLR